MHLRPSSPATPGVKSHAKITRSAFRGGHPVRGGAVLQQSQVHAQRGYVYRATPAAFYRPYGYYPHGYYRPYPFIGVGIGIGLYAPYYGSYAYPIAPGYVYEPYPRWW